ncbi:MAG: alkanesulfonate monooxygenase SsuD [Limisphaerales bacterium]|jgi:alkanesulfonate monooxygenase SsuD/methylene tetrahydromethanopterin reductase-like flavin-dependent oxidoreductase (luciferase family)
MTELKIGTIGSPEFLTGSLPDRRKLMAQVEASAIDHLFIADHVSFHTGLGMDGIVNAATLAAMSESVEILIGVYLLALRHPVTVARQLSSLSQSAPGRITLGVGIGGEDRHEMEICGVDPARRGVHTNHSLQALRNLMSGQSSSYDCDFFSYQDALIKPAPKPAIPMIVGGRSDAAIRRAALYGDGWLGVWCSSQRFANVLEQIDEIGADRPDKPNWQHGLQVWVGVGDSKKDARAYVAQGMQEMYQVPFENFERYSPYGTAQEIADFLIPYVEQGARVLNVCPRGPSEAYNIEVVSEIAELVRASVS